MDEVRASICGGDELQWWSDRRGASESWILNRITTTADFIVSHDRNFSVISHSAQNISCLPQPNIVFLKQVNFRKCCTFLREPHGQTFIGAENQTGILRHTDSVIPAFPKENKGITDYYWQNKDRFTFRILTGLVACKYSNKRAQSADFDGQTVFARCHGRQKLYRGLEMKWQEEWGRTPQRRADASSGQGHNYSHSRHCYFIFGYLIGKLIRK